MFTIGTCFVLFGFARSSSRCVVSTKWTRRAKSGDFSRSSQLYRLERDSLLRDKKRTLIRVEMVVAEGVSGVLDRYSLLR